MLDTTIKPLDNEVVPPYPRLLQVYSMKPIIFMLVVIVAAIYFVAHGGNFAPHYGDTGAHNIEDRRLGRTQGSATTRVVFLYSDEKREWVQEAHNRFVKKRPDIQVVFRKTSSVEGANAMLSGDYTIDEPTIWSPASSMVVNYLDLAWKEQHDTTLFDTQGPHAPVSLVRSPLVWVVWENLWDDIFKPTISQPWVDIGCVGDVSKVASQKPVKFFHTASSSSNSGLQAIYLMAYEYLGRPDKMTVKDLDIGFQDWFRGCEHPTREFMSSTRGLTVNMLRFGVMRYEVVVTYEQIALMYLGSAEEREIGRPRIYYPESTLWSDHPAVIFNIDKLTDMEREAAQAWIDFLLSPEMQRRSISFGFRPADPTLPLYSDDANNPFAELARFNVQRDFDSTVRAPDGKVTAELIRLWREAVGR